MHTFYFTQLSLQRPSCLLIGFSSSGAAKKDYGSLSMYWQNAIAHCWRDYLQTFDSFTKSGNITLQTFNIPGTAGLYFSTVNCIWFDHSQFRVLCIQIYSVLAKSHLVAKRNFEIWAFEVFFFWHQKHPLKWLLEGQTWISKLERIHRRFLTRHEIGSSASVRLKKWGGCT